MEKILEEIYLESKKLKDSIELIELINSNNHSKGLLLEHLVKKFVNVKVKMYQEHHNKPHIHIDIGRENHNASICIETGELLDGSIERKYIKTVSDWILKNKENLLIIWNNMQNGEKFDLSILN